MMSFSKSALNPVYGLYIVAFLIPLGQLQKYFGAAFSGIKITMVLVLLLSLANISIKHKGLIKTPIDTYLALFVTSLFVPLIMSSHFQESLLIFISIAGYLFLIVIMVTFINDKKDVRNIIYIFLISIVLVSILGILQFISGNTFLEVTQRDELNKWDNTEASFFRVVGTEVNPSAFASHYVIALPIILSLLLTKTGFRTTPILYILFILCSIVLILTFSRGGLLGAVIGLLLVLFYCWSKIQTLLPALLLVLISSILFYLFWPTDANYYVFSIFFDSDADMSYQYRVSTIGPSISMFLDNPIFGVGIGNYTYRIEDYGYSGIIAPHNNILGITSELGLLGFIPFVLIIIKVMYSVWSQIRNTDDKELHGLMVGLLGSFVGLHILGLSHMNYVNVGLWFFIGLALSCVKISKMQNVKKSFIKLKQEEDAHLSI
jgi:O-antigen ligase